MISKRYKNDCKSIISLDETQLGAIRNIDDKIKRNHYKFEYIKCQICNSSKYQLLTEKDRYGLFYPVVICIKCGLVYASPRMNQVSYNEFYEKEYRKLYVGAKLPIDKFFKRQILKGEKIYNFIKKYVPRIKKDNFKVLEIGCGAGGILHYFRDKGCFVKGIDLGEDYLNYGKTEYNLDLVKGSIDDVKIDFIPDLIIYSHVLEHILDLNSELTLIKKLISKDTSIYIEVPGIKRIHVSYKMDILLYFQNAHTYHFSLSTLNNLLFKNNYELVKGNEFIRSIYKLSDKPSNSKLLINDFSTIIKYLKAIELIRFLYPVTFTGIKESIYKLIKFFLN